MAEIDDLDAFFDEVSDVEAKVVASTASKDEETDGRDRATERESSNDEPPLKKQKVQPPVRPRGVVVAAAAVRTTISTSNSAISKTASKHDTVGPSFHVPVKDAAYTVVPPPPPPSALPAYVDPQPDSSGFSGVGMGASGSAVTAAAAAISNKKKHIRMAAGKVWVDETLDDWPDDDFRIFVGNLDPAVQDQQLFQHFSSRYASVARAKIVRDSSKQIRNQKTHQQQQNQSQQQQQQQQGGISKGYGFVSFTNALECAKAIREMDQTWLGARPIRIKRSHWKDRDFKERHTQQKQLTKQRKKFGLL